MINYKDLQEKGICWTGYKRKKGTKPYEDGSCMKEEKDKPISLKSKVMAFGRMNPITSGHEAVVNKVHEVAKKHNADHIVIVSHSQDAKKNPLTGEQKVTHAKNAFPGTNIQSASKEHPTILHHAAKVHSTGAQHLHVVAGSDRHKEMHNLLHKYNGQHAAHGHYNFKSITVHSSGERDPDAEGTTGISASKMREHAASGNKAEFHKGAPSKMKPEHKDAMYNDVRKGMNIKEEVVQEELRADMGAAAWVKDFISSTHPRFNNKSKDERRRMAIGAYMAAKSRGVKEEVQIDELSTELLGKYKTAAGADAKAADAAGNYAKGDKRFKGINKATNKQFDNDLKKHGQMKEGTLQGNIGGGDAMNTTTSAPSGSTTKDTTMNKKIKGFKFFNGENDKQMNMNQPVKEEIQEGERGLWDNIHAKRKRIENGSGERMRKPGSKGAPTADAIKASQTNEEKKDDVPFDGPYTSTFKKPNNPNRTGMDAARSLAQRAMDQLNKKKPVKEDLDEANIEPTSAKSRSHIGNLSDPITNTVVHPSSGKAIGIITKQPSGEYYAHHSAAKLSHAESGTFDSKDKAHQFIRNAHAKAIKNGTLSDRWKKQNKLSQFAEEKDEQEYGYEGDMALNQLATLTRCAEMIKDTLKPETDLPEWVQSKITLATDYIQTAADYLYSESEVNEGYYEKPASAYRRKGDEVRDPTPVAPVPDRKYIKGTPEHKAYKATKKPINGMPTNEEVLDEKSDQAKQNKTMKNMMDASRGARYKLNNPVPDTDHKTAREKNVAIGRALRSEAIAQKGVNVDKVNHAGDTPHEEKWEPAPKTVSKIKKVKEENMKSYKEFLQGLDEKLIGKQHKLDKNNNNEVDAEDFKLLRKEEADHLLEYTPGPDGKTIIKGRSYGADYVDPEGAFETAADMKKPDKKPAGRKTGQRTGSYKPRATISKLKSAGSTYK